MVHPKKEDLYQHFKAVSDRVAIPMLQQRVAAVGLDLERQLAAAHAKLVHLLVALEEAAAEAGEVALERRALVLPGLAQDEVLHRIGGDYARVVAAGVRGQEVVAEDFHGDLVREPEGWRRQDHLDGEHRGRPRPAARQPA